jgi:hypothetical protein
MWALPFVSGLSDFTVTLLKIKSQAAFYPEQVMVQILPGAQHQVLL